MPTRLAKAAAMAAIASFGSAAPAQERDRVGPAAVQWKEIVPGAHFGAVYGDWNKEAHGKYVRFVKRVQIPLHRHTNDYHAVVISGRMVNLFEGGRRVEVAPGEYFYMAPMRAHSHECLSDGGCVFYTHAERLWDFVPYEPVVNGLREPERGRR